MITHLPLLALVAVAVLTLASTSQGALIYNEIGDTFTNGAIATDGDTAESMAATDLIRELFDLDSLEHDA